MRDEGRLVVEVHVSRSVTSTGSGAARGKVRERRVTGDNREILVN